MSLLSSVTRRGPAGGDPPTALKIIAHHLGKPLQLHLMSIIHAATLAGIMLGMSPDSTVDTPTLLLFNPLMKKGKRVPAIEPANDYSKAGVSLPYCFCIINLHIRNDHCRTCVHLVTLTNGRQVPALICPRRNTVQGCNYVSLVVEHAEYNSYLGFDLPGQRLPAQHLSFERFTYPHNYPPDNNHYAPYSSTPSHASASSSGSLDNNRYAPYPNTPSCTSASSSSTPGPGALVLYQDPMCNIRKPGKIYSC
ncbi:hypothetical protein M422DRAFT_242397 [Sphaerobolus stellatus SS14]|nr:hypothetical protein M422DRAFT_242397 [Sphaerobolus stellatus SS14]